MPSFESHRQFTWAAGWISLVFISTEHTGINGTDAFRARLLEKTLVSFVVLAFSFHRKNTNGSTRGLNTYRFRSRNQESLLQTADVFCIKFPFVPSSVSSLFPRFISLEFIPCNPSQPRDTLASRESFVQRIIQVHKRIFSAHWVEKLHPPSPPLCRTAFLSVHLFFVFSLLRLAPKGEWSFKSGVLWLLLTLRLSYSVGVLPSSYCSLPILKLYFGFGFTLGLGYIYFGSVFSLYTTTNIRL